MKTLAFFLGIALISFSAIMTWIALPLMVIIQVISLKKQERNKDFNRQAFEDYKKRMNDVAKPLFITKTN